jgi:hypothetical protein
MMPQRSVGREEDIAFLQTLKTLTRAREGKMKVSKQGEDVLA